MPSKVLENCWWHSSEEFAMPCVHGPNQDCGRETVVRDMCMTHYRRWRNGEPLDTPVRGYQRYMVGTRGECQPVTRPRKEKTTPFNAEVALLHELGLR